MPSRFVDLIFLINPIHAGLLLYSLKKSEKLMFGHVFSWYFQGVQKETSVMKWIIITLITFLLAGSKPTANVQCCRPWWYVHFPLSMLSKWCLLVMSFQAPLLFFEEKCEKKLKKRAIVFSSHCQAWNANMNMLIYLRFNDFNQTVNYKQVVANLRGWLYEEMYLA